MVLLMINLLILLLLDSHTALLMPRHTSHFFRFKNPTVMGGANSHVNLVMLVIQTMAHKCHRHLFTATWHHHQKSRVLFCHYQHQEASTTVLLAYLHHPLPWDKWNWISSIWAQKVSKLWSVPQSQNSIVLGRNLISFKVPHPRSAEKMDTHHLVLYRELKALLQVSFTCVLMNAMSNWDAWKRKEKR